MDPWTPAALSRQSTWTYPGSSWHQSISTCHLDPPICQAERWSSGWAPGVSLRTWSSTAPRRRSGKSRIVHCIVGQRCLFSFSPVVAPPWLLSGYLPPLRVWPAASRFHWSIKTFCLLFPVATALVSQLPRFILVCMLYMIPTRTPDKASGAVDEFAICSIIFTQVVLHIYRFFTPQQPLSQCQEAEIATHQHPLTTPQHIL